MTKSIASQKLQKEHYNKIGSEYTLHYGDLWSQKYRDRFINQPMFTNVKLAQTKVVDALCGSGETTAYLLKKGARVTGVDISEKEMLSFQIQWPKCNALCASIFHLPFEDNFCDTVVVVGGLHHTHPQVGEAIREIHRILKVGGYFCFAEPHVGSLADVLRRCWYKVDGLFADNEAAINLDELKREFSTKFSFSKEQYRGNIAYLLVFNSMIFRIPLRLKFMYSPILLWIESLVEKVQGQLLSCFVVCQWRKVG